MGQNTAETARLPVVVEKRGKPHDLKGREEMIQTLLDQDAFSSYPQDQETASSEVDDVGPREVKDAFRTVFAELSDEGGGFCLVLDA